MGRRPKQKEVIANPPPVKAPEKAAEKAKPFEQDYTPTNPNWKTLIPATIGKFKVVADGKSDWTYDFISSKGTLVCKGFITDWPAKKDGVEVGNRVVLMYRGKESHVIGYPNLAAMKSNLKEIELELTQTLNAIGGK